MPSDRHAGLDNELLIAPKSVYDNARAANPLRWTGATRNWAPDKEIRLNREVTINETKAPASNTQAFERAAWRPLMR